MQRSKIDWADYSINPVKGLCPMACSYCYARRMYKRYHWNEEIRADWQVTGAFPTKPSRIFIGSTIELFGDWIKPEWVKEILQWPIRYPQHTFIFLTKQPQNLAKWSPFPKNCWVGVSATDEVMFDKACRWLYTLDARVKFLSIEPLLSWHTPFTYVVSDDLHQSDINWLIIGQQTPVSAKTAPKVEWLKEIVDAAKTAEVPVFLKENLNSIFAANDCALYTKYRDTFFILKDFLENGKTAWHLRQEFPRVTP